MRFSQNLFFSRSRLLHGIGLVFATLAFTLLLSHNAQAAACPATDGGAGDGDGTANGIITINANTTWNPVDATAWDCSGLDLLVTNNATLTFGSVTASGYYGYLQIDNLQIDNGAAISSNARGCPGIPGWSGGGPNTSTNVCGQYVSGYGRIGGGASGAGHGGAGGAGSTMSTVGTTYGSSTAPVLFGSSGGGENNFGPQTTGGAGGGIVRLSISENFIFNGSISANGGNGTTGGYGYAAGGGSGGSIYIVVSGAITGSTGSLSATGGAGGNNTSDGGGGGGGRISISGNDQTSFLSALSASVVVAGGSGPDSAADGGTGSLDTSLLYSRPSTPSLSSPLAASYNNSVNLNITSSSYSSNGAAHTTSDWMLKTSNNCATIDDRVWYKNDDSGNKTSITVNSTNGTFTGALSGQTALTSNTQYYACVRHSNLSGDSDWSSSVSFTTETTGYTTQIWDFEEALEYSTYNDSQYVEVDALGNGLAQLKDLGGGSYRAAGSYIGGDLYLKRVPVSVTNANGSTLTNFQVQVVVPYDADMQSDFDDIRFLDNDQLTVLDHYRSSKTDGVTATFWVEIPSLPDGGKTIYIYYGNGSVATASSFDATFTKDYSGDANLHGQWNFDEGTGSTANDSSGNVRNGTITYDGSGGWVGSDNRFSGGNSLYFDGSGDRVTTNIPINTTLNGDFTLETWFYPTNAASGWGWFFGESGGGTWLFGKQSGSASLHYNMDNLGSVGSIGTYSVNNWHHIVLSHQKGSANQFKIYIDGVLVSTLNKQNISPTTTGNIWFGARSNGETLTGRLDEMRVYTRYMSATEVLAHYNHRKYVAIEPIATLGAEANIGVYDEIKVFPSLATGEHPEYVQLGAFSATAGGGNEGNLWFQISNDGTNWYYYSTDSGTWTAVSVDSSDKNTELQVNAYLPKFTTDVGAGEIYFKAFLSSNGVQAVQLDTISLSYVPTVILTSITISDNSGYTNDTTPVLTLSQSGATPTHVAFSCNGGSNWSAWLAYPDDNVVNDDDGPAFNMTSDATGCSGSDGLKTISAKIKDGSSESSSVSDSTTLDTLAPVVSNVTSTNADGTYGAAEVITVTVQFSDTTMQVTGTPQIQLDMDGTDRQAGYVSTSTDTLSFTYTIATGDNKTDLDYTGTGALTLNGGTITDLAGNTATLTLASPGAAGSLGANKALNIVTNQAPTVSSITAAQETDGSGLVTIEFTVDDPDNDDTLQVKVEYSLNGGSSWADPTLSIVDGDTAFAFGDPDIDNAQLRQVGQTGAYLLSSSGANAGSIVWNASTDIPDSTDISNARIRLTPYDGTIEGGTGTSANFIIDLVNPTGLAGLGDSGFTSSQITLTWTAAVDSNFDHYEIWYGQSESDVESRSGSASEWDNDNDAGLATAGTTSTVLVTNPRNIYFQIFAVDDFGNEASSSSYFRSYSSGTPAPGPVPSPGNSNNDDDEEEEEVVEEEPSPIPVEEAEGHWAEGYVDYLDSQESVVEMAAEIPTFMDILVDLILNPDTGMDRGEATEFLLVFADYSVTTMSVDSKPSFTDVDEAHPRQFFIELAAELGLVNGYADGSFQPDLVVNRAEVLKLVTYFFGIEVDTSLRGEELLAAYDFTENPLTDVDLDSWYAPYVIHAYANGVVNGYGDGTFGPGNNVTKAEFLKMAILYQNFGDAVQLASELE